MGLVFKAFSGCQMPLVLNTFEDPSSGCLYCHETTARAARLEQEFLVTLMRLASNVQVFQGFRRGSLGDFATLPQMKGRRGFIRGGA